MPLPSRSSGYARLALGMLGIGTGIAAMLAADLGVGPFDLLGAGLVVRLGITFTVAGFLIHGTFALIAFAAGNPARVLPTLAVIAIGPVIDVVLPAANRLAEMLPGVAVLAFGLTVFAFGIALYLDVGVGEAPVEAVQLALEHRGVSRARARMTLDVSGGVAGFLLGGPLGWATVVLALVTGPAVAAASRIVSGPPWVGPAEAQQSDDGSWPTDVPLVTTPPSVAPGRAR